MTQIGKGLFIDASSHGGPSRFLHHSCDPNCEVEVWTVDGERRVVAFTIFTKRDVY